MKVLRDRSPMVRPYEPRLQRLVELRLRAWRLRFRDQSSEFVSRNSFTLSQTGAPVDPGKIAGVADAMFNLAMLHERGRGVRRDLRKAIKLYRRAASLGETESKLALEAIRRGEVLRS